MLRVGVKEILSLIMLLAMEFIDTFYFIARDSGLDMVEEGKLGHTWVSNDRACWRSCAHPPPVEDMMQENVWST